MMKNIADDALREGSLASVRLAAMCLIGFASFFRYSGKVQALRPTGKFSYTRFSELKQKLKDLGFPPVEFSPHSLRSGGATAAAGAGVPDRIFKRHGRWKSENAKDEYVKDTLEKHLSVTKKLGL